MCLGPEVMAVFSALSAVGSVVQGVQQIAGGGGKQDTSGQEAALAAQEKRAQDQAAREEQELNRRNAKRADANSIEAAAAAAGKEGQAGTMLTGPYGVDPDALKLEKNVLLGA